MLIAYRGFESLSHRQFTISEFLEVLRTCGAVASPAGEAERADFATICHASRGEKDPVLALLPPPPKKNPPLPTPPPHQCEANASTSATLACATTHRWNIST